jgi:hypothetical protein
MKRCHFHRLLFQHVTEFKSIDWVAGTFDGWSGLAHKRFVGVTTHYLDTTWEFKEKFLACTWLPGFVLCKHPTRNALGSGSVEVPAEED